MRIKMVAFLDMRVLLIDGDDDGDDGKKVTCDYVLTLQVQHEKLDDYQDVQDDGYQQE